MGNWALDAYNSISNAMSAVELLDSATTDIESFGFMQGTHQKVVVIKST